MTPAFFCVRMSTESKPGLEEVREVAATRPTGHRWHYEVIAKICALLTLVGIGLRARSGDSQRMSQVLAFLPTCTVIAYICVCLTLVVIGLGARSGDSKRMLQNLACLPARMVCMSVARSTQCTSTGIQRNHGGRHILLMSRYKKDRWIFARLVRLVVEALVVIIPLLAHLRQLAIEKDKQDTAMHAM